MAYWMISALRRSSAYISLSRRFSASNSRSRDSIGDQLIVLNVGSWTGYDLSGASRTMRGQSSFIRSPQIISIIELKERVNSAYLHQML